MINKNRYNFENWFVREFFEGAHKRGYKDTRPWQYDAPFRAK
jgi:hypothetical protein